MPILKISNKKFLRFFNSYVSNEIVNLKNNPKQYVLHDNLFNYKWVKILPIHYLKLYEELISQNIINSMNYAEYVLQSRFELGEPIIATNATHSFNYAFTILKSRFELGEPIIATDAYCACNYAMYVLNERFELGEPTIMMGHFYKGLYEEYFDIDLKYELNKQNT